MSSDNPFETLADLERKKKMNAQQKGKQAGGQAKTGGKKKPATTKSGELTAQDRYQKEIQKIKDVLPHIPEDTVIKQLSELNGNVDLVLMKLLEFDAGDSSRNTSSASSKSTNAAKNTPPTTKATNAANNNTANQGFTQPKYHTKGARQVDSKQSPSEAPKKFAGQGSANSRGYSQEGANNKTYPPNSNTYPAKGSAKGGSAPSPQQTGGRGGGARDDNNYAPAQQPRGGNAVLPKGPQPRDVPAKPATVMNYSAAVNRNMPAKPQPTPQQQQLSAAEALLATLEDDDFGEEEYQDFDPRDFLDEGAMGEDYIPDDYDPAEDDEEVTQELNITESSLHTLTDSKEVTVNSVTVTTDTAVTEPPSLLNGGQPITRHVQEQHTVTEVVEVGNEKANNGNPALPAAAGYEFPADRTNPNTVPAEAYQQLIVLNIQAAQRIATLETLLQQVVAKTDKLELQNNEMQTVCQQLVKTCLYLSEQQAKLQTAVSSGFPQQQGGQQPPQAQPPQQPSSFPPQPSNQYPQQYQQPTAQAQQSQAPQAKPQGMLAQGPNQGVNPAQPAPQQPQPMPAMYAQPNMNKQQAGFAGQLPHGYPSMHHQYGSSPQNQSPLMQQQYFPQGNQPGYGYPPQGMHHNPAQNRGFPQYSPQFGMQGQHMGLDPEIIEGMVRDQRNAEQMK